MSHVNLFNATYVSDLVVMSLKCIAVSILLQCCQQLSRGFQHSCMQWTSLTTAGTITKLSCKHNQWLTITSLNQLPRTSQHLAGPRIWHPHTTCLNHRFHFNIAIYFKTWTSCRFRKRLDWGCFERCSFQLSSPWHWPCLYRRWWWWLCCLCRGQGMATVRDVQHDSCNIMRTVAATTQRLFMLTCTVRMLLAACFASVASC